MGNQLKQRFSPDYLLDGENLNFTPSSKRFHALTRNTASPPIAKLTGHSASSQTNGQQSINQAIAAAVGQQTSNLSNNLSNSLSSNMSTSKASMANNSSAGISPMSVSNLTNPSILHNHLAQARQAMLEELMANRYYQSPMQQQFNLINQHLNHQIAHGGGSSKMAKQATSLLAAHMNGNLVGGHSAASSSVGNQLTNSIGNQLNNQSNNQLNKPLNNQLGGQLSGHLQANLLANSPLNGIAFLDSRYEAGTQKAARQKAP